MVQPEGLSSYLRHAQAQDVAKIAIWRGFPGKNSRKAAPVLEFTYYLFGEPLASQPPAGALPNRFTLPEPATDWVTFASP